MNGIDWSVLVAVAVFTLLAVWCARLEIKAHMTCDFERVYLKDRAYIRSRIGIQDVFVPNTLSKLHAHIEAIEADLAPLLEREKVLAAWFDALIEHERGKAAKVKRILGKHEPGAKAPKRGTGRRKP
jgi:hypothetical protein